MATIAPEANAIGHEVGVRVFAACAGLGERRDANCLSVRSHFARQKLDEPEAISEVVCRSIENEGLAFWRMDSVSAPHHGAGQGDGMDGAGERVFAPPRGRLGGSR